MVAPSFLDWPFIDSLLDSNNLKYEHFESERDDYSLPTYGYPTELFKYNFKQKFRPDYYLDDNKDWKHYHYDQETHRIKYRIRCTLGGKVELGNE